MSELQIVNNDIYNAEVMSRIKGIYNSSTPEVQQQFLTILEELARDGESRTLEQIYLADFKEIPVSIDRFLTDPYYLGGTNDNGNSIYPGWWGVYRDVFDPHKDIYEVVLSGATRLGKSSTAVSCMCYMLYLLMCYRNPQKYFLLKGVSRATIAFANLTKELAMSVAFREFHDTLIQSPWFMAHGTKNNSANNPVYVPEGNQIEIIAASAGSMLLGKQLWACMIDECNFSRANVKDISISKNHMKDLYNTANARITGTFQLDGHIYGKMFTCSSKNTDNDYLSEHIEQQLNAGNTHMYLFDKPQWEVIPPSKFSKGRFHVTVGDRFKRGFVVARENDDEQHLAEYVSQGYKVLEVPDNYRPNFLADYDIALRDIAGISVVGAMGFITQELITPNVTADRHNPFYEDYIEIGGHDNDTIERHFHLEAVPANIKGLQMYIHFDLAESSDHVGICGVVQDGTKVVTDVDTDKKVVMPFLKEVFQVSIGAPRGDRMSFQKAMNFVLWLRNNGFWIQTVTADKYQSSYFLESLNQQGINAEHLSVDKTMDAYKALRNVLYDQRIELIKCDLQEVEMIHLQRIGDDNNGRIDHPSQSACFTGDTKIQLVDGRSLTINELLTEQQYRTNWVYTINETTGLIEPKPILDVFQTKLTKDLVKVTLDNDEVIFCTPDHRFMLRDGSYETAENLSSGDSLMPLYTKVSEKGLHGYRMYYEPMEGKWHYEHRQFCFGHSSVEKNIVHHCNYNKLDNTPTNLQRVSKSEHRRIHNNSTVDYTQTAKSLCDWYVNNKDTEEYKLRTHKGSVTTIINNHYKKTGEHLSIVEAEAISNKNAVAEKTLNRRIHDIELLFNVEWSALLGRERVAYGCKLSAVVSKIEQKYSVDWSILSDSEKYHYYDIYMSDRLLVSLERAISGSLNQVLAKYPIKYTGKPKHASKSKAHRHIRTVASFSPDVLRIWWIECLFGIDWSESTPAERGLATRRFNKLLNSGEYIPLDVKIKYIPKPKHIIKSVDLFGSDMDIKFKNIEELYGVHMGGIPRNQRSGYCRKYNNFCKGKVNKKLAAAKALQRRIAEIERIYGVSWKDLDTADKSKYSLKYHNLMNPEEKKSHYNATSDAISQHSWYTDGVNNMYIKNGDSIPDGFRKGRTILESSVAKGIATVKNRTPEQKAAIAKKLSEDTSRRIWITNGTVDKYIYRDTPIPEGFRLGRCKIGKNHKVKSVERITMPCRVYDLTIKDNHNFALSAGVFAHNSVSAVPTLANGYNSKGIGKDASDSLAGACFSCIKNAEQIKPPPKNVLGAMAGVNRGMGYLGGGSSGQIPWMNQYKRL